MAWLRFSADPRTPENGARFHSRCQVPSANSHVARREVLLTPVCPVLTSQRKVKAGAVSPGDTDPSRSRRKYVFLQMIGQCVRPDVLSVQRTRDELKEIPYCIPKPSAEIFLIVDRSGRVVRIVRTPGNRSRSLMRECNCTRKQVGFAPRSGMVVRISCPPRRNCFRPRSEREASEGVRE